MQKRYAVVYEWSGRNYGAFSPDVPGCIATGKTLDETRAKFAEALTAHLALMARDGDPIPDPAAAVEYLEVEIPSPVAAA